MNKIWRVIHSSHKFAVEITIYRITSTCQKCGNQDTESHLLWCSGYSEKRENLDLDSDKDLCKYLQKIIQERCQEKKN